MRQLRLYWTGTRINKNHLPPPPAWIRLMYEDEVAGGLGIKKQEAPACVYGTRTIYGVVVLLSL